MKDALTMAHINLFAVLRNLEELCELDQEAGSLIKGKSLDIQFVVRNGPSAVLCIEGGKCRLKKGKGHCDIKLYFSSPEHLNRMFDGKADPILLKGLTKLGFLKSEFTKLTERLGYYLKPTDVLLENAAYKKANTILTAYTAFFALAEIGNLDSVGKLHAARIPDGTIQISVTGGPAIHIKAEKGRLEAEKGIAPEPRAVMSFSNMEVAGGILNGKIDSYTCIATGDIRTMGFVPMLDYLNKLLLIVPGYLK